jgi:hypothetical protein
MPQHLSDVPNDCERLGKLNVRGKALRALAALRAGKSGTGARCS